MRKVQSPACSSAVGTERSQTIQDRRNPPSSPQQPPHPRYPVHARPIKAPEEVSAAVATSFTVLLAVIVLPLLHEGLEQERDERRRAMLVASAVMTVVVVASPLVGPVKGFLLSRDGHLKARYVSYDVVVL